MIQAALNGARGTDWHPAVPVDPDAIAADAAAVVAAGAACLHVHPRGADGLESLEPDAVEPVLRAVRAAVPGVPVGISTGAWIAPRGRARIDRLAALVEKPDYVSVNLSEEDAPDVIAAALGLGIGVEAGLFDVADVDRLATLPQRDACLRLLVEIGEQDEAAARAAFDAVVLAIVRHRLEPPPLAHGFDDQLWSVNRAAVGLGLDIRTGLEDGRLLPDGGLARDNADLVAAAVRLVQSG